ncbi:hypothetical protein AB1K56_07955 [Microbacterium sp. BWR-S6Y]|uniref:hypothetical protein n=1 Tax=Microbacterium sp. BWR-S6Y TaxID=3232073 RepID=UPI0035280B1D
MVWEVDVHESWEGKPLLDIAEIVESSKQTTNLGGTGTGTHVLQLRGSGLFSKQPTAAERAFARSLFRLWASKIVVRRDGVTAYDGWIAKRRFDPQAGTLTLTTVEMRAAIFRVRLTYPVKRHLEGDLIVTNRGPEGAVRAILGKTLDWGYGFFIPIDKPADSAGSFSASWYWYQHLTIEDLLQQVEDTGHEVYFRPYRAAGDVARYQTVAAPEVLGETRPISLSAAQSAVTSLADEEDGARMLTGIEYQGNGTDQDALYAGSNWDDLYPGQDPTVPNRDTIRNAKDVTDVNVLRDTALADMRRDHQPTVGRKFDLQMNATVTAAWGMPGEMLETKQRADEWNDDTPKTYRVVSCTTDVGTDTLGLDIKRHGS